jgi:hypothetical protein
VHSIKKFTKVHVNTFQKMTCVFCIKLPGLGVAEPPPWPFGGGSATPTRPKRKLGWPKPPSRSLGVAETTLKILRGGLATTIRVETCYMHITCTSFVHHFFKSIIGSVGLTCVIHRLFYFFFSSVFFNAFIFLIFFNA